MRKKFTIPKNRPEGFANLREKFYHPIYRIPRPPRANVPYHLYLWVMFAIIWVAAARSDASVLFM